MKKERYRVTLGNLREEDDACRLLRESGIEVVSLGRSKFDMRVIFDLAQLIQKTQPDIIHVHSYASWIFSRIATLIKNKR